MLQIEACTPTLGCVRATATGEQSEKMLLKTVGITIGVAILVGLVIVAVQYRLNQ